MITKVIIKDNSNSPINYLPEVNQLYNGREIIFKPGINIIVGTNGSGKSTLLKLIEKYLLMAEDTQNGKYIDKLFDYSLHNPKMKDGIDVYSEYAYATFRFCHMDELLKNGGEDWLRSMDTFTASLTTMQSSTGQGVVIALTTLFKKMFSPKTNLSSPTQELIEYRKNNKDENSSKYKKIDKYLKYVKEHQITDISQEDLEFTVLLDEPDRNLDISNLREMSTIFEPKEKTQIICTIHNPLLIYRLYKRNKNINWIEMEDGYINQIINEIESLI